MLKIIFKYLNLVRLFYLRKKKKAMLSNYKFEDNRTNTFNMNKTYTNLV